MNYYYELLGLPPNASKAEIKNAYRQLCLECHPDKLPPTTPKKARQIVEDHFKQINEAYAYLMGHPSVSDQPRDTKGTTQTPRSIFDPERMEAVGRQLEAEREDIEHQYQQQLESIDQQQRQTLANHNLNVKDLDKYDIPTKISMTVFCIILGSPSLLGFHLGGVFSIVAGLWFLFCCLLLLGILTSGIVSTRTYQVISSIKKETEAAKTRIQEQKKQRLQTQESRIRSRVNHFKTLPLSVLSESFIQDLSDHDQFFLLLAIKEREDADKLSRNIQIAIKIAGGIGLVLMMSRFLLGIPF